ncbi:hypothetical protein BaRGS_00028314 [Batillaria attramentaria]|uniref:Adaptor protein pacsin n=1 Tax=Batillaria attramentaria TaxID=370345 RepID=A0ABD0JZ25_9CAEN
MSVNDDLIQASSDSFWEVGKYMRTVKRCDNGYKLCDHLRQLIEQRADIEKKYASHAFQRGPKNGTTSLPKASDMVFCIPGPEYGTGQGAWRGVLQEADQLSDLHTDMAERLMNEAQKPWGKRLGKVLTARKEYHTACRTEKSTANQENNARGDSAQSADNLRKLQEKLKKCQQDVEATREKYQACLNDLNGYTAKYIEDMTEVYDKCQEFERKRIDFFKKALFDMHRCLDLSVDPKFARVYTDLHATIANSDPDKDLKWWSSNHGVDMAMAWPTFEEYSPELQAISKRGKGAVNTGEGGITITGIRHTREDSVGSFNADQPPPAYSASTQQRNATAASAATSRPNASSTNLYDDSLNPFGDDEEEEDNSNKAEKTAIIKQAQSQNKNGQGWAVRALYDYDKAEDDEIGFKAGDVFVQLSTEDEMGWCKGRKDGIIVSSRATMLREYEMLKSFLIRPATSTSQAWQR